MRLESPFALLLLLGIPLLLEPSWRQLIVHRLGLHRLTTSLPSIHFSSAVPVQQLPCSMRVRLRPPVLSALLVGSFSLLVVALARPQTGTHFVETIVSGRDIMLVLDVSRSMEALDFEFAGKRLSKSNCQSASVTKTTLAAVTENSGTVYLSDVRSRCCARI